MPPRKRRTPAQRAAYARTVRAEARDAARLRTARRSALLTAAVVVDALAYGSSEHHRIADWLRELAKTQEPKK